MVSVIGATLLEWGIGKAADALFDQTSQQVKARLNKTDFQQAIAAGVQSALQYETSISPAESLFYHCSDKEVSTFKKTVFSNSSIQDELQRPLRNEGKPRLDFLIAGFRLVASNIEIKLNEKGLKPWLEKFVDTYFEQTSLIQFKVAKQDYCKQIVNWYDDIKFAGIAIEGRVIEEAKDLERIFVMPDAVKEKERSFELTDLRLFAESVSGWPISEKSENPDFDAKNNYMDLQFLLKVKASDLYQQVKTSNLGQHALFSGAPGSGKSKFLSRWLMNQQSDNQWSNQSDNQWSNQKILASSLLCESESKKLVVLGAPGSGKTTLMSYIVVILAKEQPDILGLPKDTEWLPILIRIRDLAANPDLSIPDYAKQFAEKTMSCMPLPVGFFEAWLQDGKALILLDGLDEVAEEGKRQETVRKIENFLGQYSQNRAIITSRPAGYRRDFFRTTEYPHYLLQPFDDAKIECFITNWYDSRTPDQDESERRKANLRKALADNDRIKLLARNPLLLTIIALIHRYQARLPRERYELYDRAVKTLINTWDDYREITSHKALQHLRLDDLRRIMERLAYWVHTQGGIEDQEGSTLIDHEDLITQLSQYIRDKKKKLERYEAKAEAERFLKHIQERTGLLNEQGQDRYAFVHKTFQEYLAAQEIHDQKEDGFEIVLQHIRDHLHDPHWREVLLLLIAQQKRRNLDSCLKEILRFSEPCDQWLYRSLFFAGSCLVENIPTTDESIVVNILDELVALETSASPLVTSKIKGRVFDIFSKLHETDFSALALERLLNSSIIQHDPIRLQEYRAALGQKEDASLDLIEILRNSNSRSLSARVVSTIIQLGYISNTVTDQLLDILRERDSNICYYVIEIFIYLDSSSEKFLSELFNLLQDSRDELRYMAADTLAQLGHISEEALKELMNLMKKGDKGTALMVASTLIHLEPMPSTVIHELLGMIQNIDDNTYFEIVEELGQIDNPPKLLIDNLFALLTVENRTTQIRAAQILVQSACISDDLINVLLDLLKDSDLDTHFRAAEILADLVDSPEALINELLALLKSEDSNMRSSAAWILGHLGISSNIVVDGLLDLLQDQEDKVRSEAGEALVSLNQPAALVLDELLAQIKNTSSQIRSRAVGLLGRFEYVSSAVVDELLTLLKDDDINVRSKLASTLGELKYGSDSVINALLVLLKDSNNNVRSRAASALGQLDNTTDIVIDELLSLLKVDDKTVYSKAAGALGQLGKSKASVIPKLVQWLDQNSESAGASSAVNVLWDLIVGQTSE